MTLRGCFMTIGTGITEHVITMTSDVSDSHARTLFVLMSSYLLVTMKYFHVEVEFVSRKKEMYHSYWSEIAIVSSLG